MSLLGRIADWLDKCLPDLELVTKKRQQKLKCRSCGHAVWMDVDKLRPAMRCGRCGHIAPLDEFKWIIGPPGEEEWR